MPASNETDVPLPWLTALLLCVFAVATWQGLIGSSDHTNASRQQLLQAVRYLHEHPYLETAPVLRARVDPAELAALRRQYDEANVGKRVLGFELRSQQRELDALVAQAVHQVEDMPARRFGVNPKQWRPDTLFTYVVVHASWLHLGGCAALLLFLGLYLEPSLGAIRLVGIATAATLGAAAGYVFTHPELDRVLLGSSGMLAGLLCVFAWEHFASRKESFYRIGLLGGVGWLVALPAAGVGLSFEHAGAHLTGFVVPQSAHVWHGLGGIIGATAANGVMRLLGARPATSPAVRHAARTSTGSADLDAALALRAEGREEAALKQLVALVQREPDSIDASLLLADVASSLGQSELARKSRLRVVRLESKRGDGLGAVRPWLDLTQREIPTGVEPELLIRMAGLLRHKDHPRAASMALQAALDRADKASRMVVAGRVARAAKEIDPAVAHDAAWTALGFIELPFVERQEMERILSQVLPRLPGAQVETSKAWEGGIDRPASIEIDTALRVLDVVHAVPIDLDDEGLHVSTKGGLKKRILFDRVEAVGVAGVRTPDRRPVLVIDLVLNWMAPNHESLRVVRLRSDGFDPRQVVEAESALDALRLIVMTVMERAEAVPLPGRDAVLGRPFATFDDIGRYSAQVLLAEEPLSENPS